MKQEQGKGGGVQIFDRRDKNNNASLSFYFKIIGFDFCVICIFKPLYNSAEKNISDSARKTPCHDQEIGNLSSLEANEASASYRL